MQFQHMPSSKNSDTQSCQAGNTFLFYGCKNCGEHILSVVNHSKTREQSFSMNSSYALNGTHEDRLGTNVTTLKVAWHWGKNEVKLKAWSEGMKTIRRAEGGASGEMKNTKVLKEDKNHLKDKSILLMSKINIFLNHNLQSVWWIWSVNFTPERRKSVSNANVV